MMSAETKLKLKALPKTRCVVCKKPRNYFNPMEKCDTCRKFACYDCLTGVLGKHGVENYCDKCGLK